MLNNVNKLYEVMGLKIQKACRDPPKPQRIERYYQKLPGTTRNSQGKDRTVATTSKAGKGNSIIRRRADTKTSK